MFCLPELSLTGGEHLLRLHVVLGGRRNGMKALSLRPGTPRGPQPVTYGCWACDQSWGVRVRALGGPGFFQVSRGSLYRKISLTSENVVV